MKKLLSLVFICALCLAGAGQALAAVVNVSGNITTNTTWTSSNVYELDGLVVVTDGATLTIEAGTLIYGLPGSGSATSYLIVDSAGNDVGGTYAPGAKIIAIGTAADPIIFTSEAAYLGNTEAPGQWGGLTIIGNAGNPQVGCYEVDPRYCPTSTNNNDNSGALRYVQINNSGITMDIDKEINGLSLCAVGKGTTIDNVSVLRSDDDCVELWGGSVNLSNIYTEYCTDDQFDTDDGYSGTVSNLTIYQHTDGNAAMEMSGDTPDQKFVNVEITQDFSDKEGVIYFKESNGIGGTFTNVVVRDNVADAYGAIHTNAGTGTLGAITFDNVDICSDNISTNFTGPSAAELEAIFDACVAGGGGSCAPSGGSGCEETAPCP